MSVSETDNLLPVVAGTWEQDEEPQCLLYDYKEIPGSTIPFENGTTAVSLFCRYFTDEVWNLLVTETNRYSLDNLSHKPNAHAWSNVSVDEMKVWELSSFHNLICTGKPVIL